MKSHIIPGARPPSLLDRLLKEAAAIGDAGSRTAYISGLFLGTPYKASTLPGPDGDVETLVINLAEVDCLTFIEYVEAMRRSDSFRSFSLNLLHTRYRSGRPAFRDRNHFLTDWREHNGLFFFVFTKETGGGKALGVLKTLNRKKDGSEYVRGIPAKEREVDYIPSTAIDPVISDRLKTGDYAGIYSEEPGLDVSHAGIIIRADGVLMFRHASSVAGRVVDEDFNDYMSGRPGLIVLRPV
ncbi:MAG: DUF1460 domain-containing protein [Nitrospirae bacterium]|nr:DUF1460 domain-containing protein [Nitrospirota bacterium]